MHSDISYSRSNIYHGWVADVEGQFYGVAIKLSIPYTPVHRNIKKFMLIKCFFLSSAINHKRCMYLVPVLRHIYM